MKAIFFWLRLLAWIKRGVLALESVAESQRAIAEAVVAPTRRKGAPKMAEIHTPSIEDRNLEWQRRQDESIYGDSLE